MFEDFEQQRDAVRREINHLVGVRSRSTKPETIAEYTRRIDEKYEELKQIDKDEQDYLRHLNDLENETERHEQEAADNEFERRVKRQENP